MPTIECLSAEVLKVRRSVAFGLVLGVPLAVVVVVTVAAATRSRQTGNAFDIARYSQTVRALWGAFVWPTLLALLAAFLAGLEHRNDNWKLTLAQPVPRRSLWMAKAIVLIGLATLAHIVLLIGLLAGATWLGLPTAGWPGQAKLLAAAVAASLPVLAIQLWLSFRRRAFFVPVAVGLAGQFVSVVSDPPFFPWRFPFEALQVGGALRGSTTADLAVAALMGLFLFAAGGWDLRQRDIG